MSTEYDNNSEEMIVHCDSCHKTYFTEGAFKDCVDEIKNEGWKVYMNSEGEWSHSCPECFEEWKDSVQDNDDYE